MTIGTIQTIIIIRSSAAFIIFLYAYLGNFDYNEHIVNNDLMFDFKQTLN